MKEKTQTIFAVIVVILLLIITVVVVFQFSKHWEAYMDCLETSSTTVMQCQELL